MWWCEIVGNDSEILAAPTLETRFETLVRVSHAIAAHRDPKELFGVLVNELHRVVQFDFIGVSFRDKDSDTFQNYFIDMTSRAELVPEEKLTPEETLTLRVYERQEPVLRSTNEMEPCCARLQAILKKALYSLHLCPTVDDGAPQTRRYHVRQ
jgi:transcriptional regulator with GAF, ATPase, and Fis domain